MKISLDTNAIIERCFDSMGLNADAEKALVDIIKLRDEIDRFIEEAKAKIKREMTADGNNLTVYVGEYIKAELRKYGGSYAIEQPEKVDPAFIKVKEVLDTKAVKAFEDEVGMLPTGIERIEREPQLTIKIKEV